MQKPVNQLRALAAPLGPISRAVSGLGAPSESRLFRKYAALLVALVASSLVVNAAIEMYYSWHENREPRSVAVQREKAHGAAAIIEQFLREIEGQVGWTTHASVLSGRAASSSAASISCACCARRRPSPRSPTSTPTAASSSRFRASPWMWPASGADRSAESRFAGSGQPALCQPGLFPQGIRALPDARDRRRRAAAPASPSPRSTSSSSGTSSRASRSARPASPTSVDERGLLIAHPDIGLVLQQDRHVRPRPRGGGAAPQACRSRDRRCPPSPAIARAARS